MYDKRVLAFHYAWYGTPWGTGDISEWLGWNSHGYNPEIVFHGVREAAIACYPLDGLYDSCSEYTIKRQIYQARQALIDGFIVSWWGFPEKLGKESGRYKTALSADCTLRKMLSLAPEGFNITLYYETAIYREGDDIVKNIIEDFTLIAERYGKHPRWLKVNGKPVIVIYGRVLGEFWSRYGSEAINIVKKIRNELENRNISLFLIGDCLKDECIEIFDGLHTYNPIGFTTRGIDLKPLYKHISDELHKRGKLWVATVTPGFDNYRVANINRLFEPRQGGRYYIDSWNTALDSNPDWIFITSWNEWYECSSIEPSIEFGTDYLYLTRQQITRFKGLK